MLYYLKLLIIHCIFAITFIHSIIASENWFKENKSCIESILKHNRPIEECLRFVDDKSDPDVLMMYLHTYEHTPSRDALSTLVQLTYVRAQRNAECLFNFSLICQRIGFRDLTQRSGQQAIEQTVYMLDLANMSLEFKKKKLNDLSTQAAKRSVMLLREVKEPNYVGRGIGHVLVNAQHYDLASQAYLHTVKHESHWPTLFEIYQHLKKIDKESEADTAFTKILLTIQAEAARFGTGWFLYIARECAEDGYVDDAKKAARKAIENESSPRQLANHLKQLKWLEFNELKQMAAKKLGKLFQQHPTNYGFKEMCQILFEVSEIDIADQMCSVVLPTYDNLQSFPDLIDLITLLNRYKQTGPILVALRRALNLCQPQDILFACIDNFSFVSPTTCALVTSKLSQDCDQPMLAREAADYAIRCALAEPYDTTEQLVQMLGGLEGRFHLLHFPDLSQKVTYYKSEVSAPAIPRMSKKSPSPFEIYWTDLEGTQGCEIYKTRPCVVITSPSSYNNRNIVTVVPLSTQTRGGIASIPVFLKTEKEEERLQEARLDQARSVDVSRLLDFFGDLPAIYQSQLKLAFKNYVG